MHKYWQASNYLAVGQVSGTDRQLVSPCIYDVKMPTQQFN